jgi:hypothetical protein
MQDDYLTGDESDTILPWVCIELDETTVETEAETIVEYSIKISQFLQCKQSDLVLNKLTHAMSVCQYVSNPCVLRILRLMQ